jgi:four helix bundle protein
VPAEPPRDRDAANFCGYFSPNHLLLAQGARSPSNAGEAKKYERFEQLPAWQAGIELAVGVYALTSKPAFQRQRSLRDQIERAAVSVSNNIAEGFERGTNQELLTFLYISRGSAGEVRSMLCLLERLPAFGDLASEILNLKSKAESVSRQLGAWIRSLQDSSLKGHRYVTEKTRRADAASLERKAFLKELEKIRNMKS